MTDVPVAPSEEYVISCDVSTCPAQLSMVSGVNRSEHGWGRVSVYGDENIAPEHRYSITSVSDYDLCPVHYREVTAVLHR